MPAHAAITVHLDDELSAKLRELRDELVPALEAAGQLAHETGLLLNFVPPDVNPIVLVRERLVGLQAARDAFVEAAGPLLEHRQPSA